MFNDIRGVITVSISPTNDWGSYRNDLANHYVLERETQTQNQNQIYCL